MLNTPFANASLRKKLNMFQFVTNEPCIKQMVAVNPKEYCCLYEDDKLEKRHKGVPKKVNIEFQTYKDRVHSFEFLKENEKFLKSESVTYKRLAQEKNKTFMKETTKVQLGGINDKVYVFSDGILTLPHGHALLQPIYNESHNKTSVQLQDDAHINKLLELEGDIIEKHPRLKYLRRFYDQNRHKF